jgi:hypothetical protein
MMAAMNPPQLASVPLHPLADRASELAAMRAAVNHAIGALRAGRPTDALLVLEAIPVRGHFSDERELARIIDLP